MLVLPPKSNTGDGMEGHPLHRQTYAREGICGGMCGVFTLSSPLGREHDHLDPSSTSRRFVGNYPDLSTELFVRAATCGSGRPGIAFRNRSRKSRMCVKLRRKSLGREKRGAAP